MDWGFLDMWADTAYLHLCTLALDAISGDPCPTLDFKGERGLLFFIPVGCLDLTASCKVQKAGDRACTWTGVVFALLIGQFREKHWVMMLDSHYTMTGY